MIVVGEGFYLLLATCMYIYYYDYDYDHDYVCETYHVSHLNYFRILDWLSTHMLFQNQVAHVYLTLLLEIE